MEKNGFSVHSLASSSRTQISQLYTLWISRCIATTRERIPGSIDNYVTGVSECSRQKNRP
ncbi:MULTISPECIES: hypothetical protein [Photorhabdus]|uniref:hypothetical protein n=1 Tax=Photorhabdus TaxID=29487 RepID=UPI001E2F2FFE|nr:hypothetical protein [Photorhabdus bodei]MCC8465854.1 hypothetical protein [Photorhabdus bodei]